MKVRELILKLQALGVAELPIIALEPRLVYVDDRIKPGCWNEQPNETCKYRAVRLG